MITSERITPMLLANAAFCIENWHDVKPETRQSIINTLLQASEELSAAAHVAPTEGADARPVAIYQVMTVDNLWDDTDWLTYESTGSERRIVYATRDAAPSDRQDAERYRAIRTISVAEMTWPSDSEFDAYIDETIDSAPREAT